jgi:hypothetical protein
LQKLGLKEDQYILQHYYKPPEENYGFLGLSNRAGNLPEEISKIDIPEHGCNIPFYQLTVHWNGDILLCGHDWEKETNHGQRNEATCSRYLVLKSKKLWEFRQNVKG